MGYSKGDYRLPSPVRQLWPDKPPACFVDSLLAARGLLKDVDFLSSVSGGGYTGSFITTRLGSGAQQTEIAGSHGPDPEPIRYLRQHAKYLRAVNLKDAWSMVTVTLAGMLLNRTVPLFVIVVAALIATEFVKIFPEAQGWPIALAISGGLTGIALVLYCWLIRQGRQYARLGGGLLGALVAVTVTFGASWLLYLGYNTFLGMITSHKITSGIFAGFGGLAVAAPAIMRFLPVLQSPVVRKITLKVLLLVAGLVVPLIALILFYAGRYVGELPVIADAPAWNPLHYMSGECLLLFVAGILAFVAVGLLNINLTAPHRPYRDRLAKTFVQRKEDSDETVELTHMNLKSQAPYHLLNCTVNLPSSQHPALRDRKSDFFLFSKHWCGSASTGYCETDKWKMNNSPADLATAMAISGAAASSYMGLGSMPSLTALLTFLNVRLGFWILQPNTKKHIKAPGFLCLVREMTGIAMSEKYAWLNLSDGGHIENMAIYELLRRRCKFIICVDGEADPGLTFEGLMTLVRHAQIDFGVRIEPKLNDLRPDPKTGYSQAHATLCRIHYENGGGAPNATGLLLYMKLSVTGNESELIKRYRITHSDFPHQSTLDQFFDEEQFEAYRQLGVHVAEGLFSRTLMNGNVDPSSIPEWFRQLAENLLEPEKM